MKKILSAAFVSVIMLFTTTSASAIELTAVAECPAHVNGDAAVYGKQWHPNSIMILRLNTLEKRVGPGTYDGTLIGKGIRKADVSVSSDTLLIFQSKGYCHIYQ